MPNRTLVTLQSASQLSMMKSALARKPVGQRIVMVSGRL